MAKDFEALRKRLEYYVDDTVDEETAIILFNACNEDISEAARYAITKEADFDKDVSIITLPLDCIKIVELKIKLDGETSYRRIYPINLVQPNDLTDPDEWHYPDRMVGYELWGDSVEIRPAQSKSGKLLIRYFGHLPEITDLDEIPVIKPQFHDVYALYGAYKYYQNYQDELEAKNDYYQEYLNKKNEMDQFTMNLENKTKSKTVYQFRSWT